MSVRLILSGLVLFGLLGTAATVKAVDFTATVTASFGPNSELFTTGDVVNVYYELDEGVADTNPSPGAGVFPGATLSLIINFPDSRLSFNFGSGNLQTFDNTNNPDDQVFIFASEDRGSSLLGGESVNQLELDFGGPISMLSSDAIPANLPLSGNVDSIVVFIGTDSGFAQVNLSATRLQINDELIYRETRYNPPPGWIQGDNFVFSVYVIDLDTGTDATDVQVTATNTNTGEVTNTLGDCGFFGCEKFAIIPYTVARALSDWTLTATQNGDTASSTLPAYGTGPGTGPMPGVDNLTIPNNSATPTFSWTTPDSVVDGTANDGNVDRFRIRIHNDGRIIYDQRLTTGVLNTTSFTIPSGIITEPGNNYVGQVLVEGFNPYIRSRTFQQFSVAPGPGVCGTLVTTDITLDSDMVCPATAFRFSGNQSSNTVLDCAGFSITSTGGRVITANNVAGITIKNCKISTSVVDGRGILLTDVIDSTIVGNTISTSGSYSHGINLRGNSSSNLVTDNRVHTSGSSSPALRIQGKPNNNTVTNNTFEADGSYAIVFQSSSDNEIAGNALISPNGYLWQGNLWLQAGGMSVDSAGNIYAVENDWGSGNSRGIGTATAFFLVDSITGKASSVIKLAMPLHEGQEFGFDALEVLPNGRVLALAGPGGDSAVLYAINPDTGEVSTIDLVQQALPGKMNGLEAISNTELYATTNGGGLALINLVNIGPGQLGSVTLIGSQGIGWTGLSIHPTTGRAYTISRWRDEPSQTAHLYEINLEDGQVIAEIGDTGLRWLSDIDFAPDGTLYADFDLAVIDITTGQGTTVGGFGGDPLEPLSQNNSLENNVMQTARGSINFKGNIILPSVAETDVSSARVRIGPNEAMVDAVALPFLNEPARISLFGLSGEGPTLLIDENDDGSFEPCLVPQCTLLGFTGGTLTFDVAGFTTYSSSLGVDFDGDGILDDEDPCPSDPLNDADGDFICAGEGAREPNSGDNDNCPSVSNPGQEDTDADGAGDACDAFPLDPDEQKDTDGDGVGDNGDKFPADPFESADLDRDGLGDTLEKEFNTDPADPDTDGDSPDDNGDEFPDIPDGADNCPAVPNPLQLDSDGDSDPNGDGVIDHHASFGVREYPLGDACDPDDDNDGVPDDAPDNCPLFFNPEQIDADLDGIGLGCDECDDPKGCADSGLSAKGSKRDDDQDGLSNSDDNCPSLANPLQEDDDGDGIGNVCDLCPADTDNDSDADSWCVGAVFAASQSGGNDNCPVVQNFSQLDTDGDGVGDACDVATNPAGGGGTDADLDTFFSIASGGDDCDDTRASVNPATAEIEGNGLDDDCDPGTPDGPYWIQIETDKPGDWLPRDGDSVIVTATVQGPGGPVDGAVTNFTCMWTSFPGKYTNDPSTDESADGECIPLGGNALQLNISDYAAMVTISVDSTFTDAGTELMLSTEQRIPSDRDNDFLPDAYEDRFGRDVHPGEDLDVLTGRGVVGDGLKALAEYRGQLGFEPLHDNLLCGSHPSDPATCLPETASGYVTPAYVPNGNYGFNRLDVDRPTLFLNYGNYDALHPFVLGQGFEAANMEIYVFDLDSGIGAPGGSNIDVVTMTNFGSPFGFESGHTIHRQAPRDFTYGTLGNCGVGDGNVYGGSCRLFMPAIDNLVTDRPYRDGDPDGSGADGILNPLTLTSDDPIFVEDSNDNGTDDGKGQRTESSSRTGGDDSLLEGDLFVAGRFDLDLSAFNVDGDDPVLIEMPLVAQEDQIAPGFEYSRIQIYSMINSHELGHSLGATHNAVEADPMFNLTTNFRRNEVFLSPSLSQFNIHNTCPAGSWCDIPSP